MNPAVIEVRSLTKVYGRNVAVDALDFDVAAGSVTGFLGPNGAGKTTTLRAILGLIRPDAGETRVFGAPYERLGATVRRVGALIDGQGFHPARTARAHLRVLTAMAGLAAARIDEVLDLVDLSDAADRRVGTFSLGMRQRLGLAGALIGEPDVLVLDEPANGLDPAGISWMRSFLRSYADDGRTAFVSSHVLSEMTNLVDEVIVVRRGKLVVHAPTRTLIQGDQVLANSPEPARLAQALERKGATIESQENGGLRIGGLSVDEVGDVARTEGITLHELTRTTQTLEDVFLQLTEGEDCDA